MLSVWPPEQAEKRVSAILPPYITTWPRVAVAAALLVEYSLSRPL